MWPTCIGLATFGELKSMTTVFGAAAFSKNRCSPRAAAASVCVEHGIFQPEIQEARAGDFHFFANVRKHPVLPGHRSPAGADSVSASWRATSARCFGNRQISDRDKDGLKRRRHRRPAKFRGRRLAVSVRFVCAATRELFNHGWTRMDTDFSETWKQLNGTPPIAPVGSYFFPCSWMTASMVSASVDFSRASRNSALCRSLAMLASVWRCF